jgi:hypothetical protein
VCAGRRPPPVRLGLPQSSTTKPQPDGTLAVTLRLAHRGGLVVDHAPFRAISNCYIVIHVQSYVERGIATVWLTLRPGM